MVITANKNEEIVVSWLKSHGYYRVETTANNCIEADGKMRRMTVAISTPETKNEITECLKNEVIENHREIWMAVVESDDDIMWYPIK